MNLGLLFLVICPNFPQKSNILVLNLSEKSFTLNFFDAVSASGVLLAAL